MGEQPIFTTKAHVFQIDPKTRKNWLPSSQAAVPVSFFYDSTRSTYRVISVEGTKAIINSTITPNMQFTKTSQKFGQWADSRANTVYGLGFTSEPELMKFIEKFKEVKEATRIAYQKVHPHMNGVGGAGHHHTSSSPHHSPKHNSSTASSTTSSTITDSPIHARSQSATSSPAHLIKENSNANSLPNSPSLIPAGEAHLKYENDRLKIALAQSSSNAKKWEVELQTLKNNNARLTTALQESTQNVEEWKQQLHAYREECDRLKLQLSEESKGSVGGGSPQLTSLRSQVEALETENKLKQDEIRDLSDKLHELSLNTNTTAALQRKLQEIEGENVSLQEKVAALEKRVSRLGSPEVVALHQEMGERLNDVCRLQERIMTSFTS